MRALFSISFATLLVACGSSSDPIPAPAGDAAADAPPIDGGSIDARTDALSEAGCPKLPEDENAPHFSYDDTSPEGPKFWGELKKKDGTPAYPDCASTTKQQSPIVVPSLIDEAAFALGAELVWPASATVSSLLNNGHTWQANIDGAAAGIKLRIDTTEFSLAQFHFHTPAEHVFEGAKAFPMELHFVHLGPSGPGAPEPFATVVGVMVEESSETNEELEKIWPKFAACPQTTASPLGGTTINLTKLLPGDRSYAKYDGSLTTPKCLTKVRFHVLKNPIKASKAQIEKAREAVHGKNARPTQAILPSTTITDHVQPPPG